MNAVSTNPFQPHSLATGEALVGRVAELSWLHDQLSHGKSVLIEGARRMGASSLAREALTAWGRERGSPVLCFACDRLHSPAALVASMREQLLGNGLAEQRPGGALSVLGKMIATNVNPEGSGAEEALAALFEVLDQLRRRAKTADANVAVLIDRVDQLGNVGGDAFAARLSAALHSKQPISFVLCANQDAFAHQAPLSRDLLRDRVELLQLRPIDSSLVASWIDGKMGAAGVAPNGAGEAIVEKAGPRVGDAVSLAAKTFELSLGARVASRAHVELAFKRTIKAGESESRKTWEGLSPDEKAALHAIAEGKGQAVAQRDQVSQVDSSNAAKLRTTAESLLRKGAVERVTEAGLQVSSPELKGYVLQARLALKRQSTGRDQRDTKLNFELGVHRAPKASNGVTL